MLAINHNGMLVHADNALAFRRSFNFCISRWYYHPWNHIMHGESIYFRSHIITHFPVSVHFHTFCDHVNNIYICDFQSQWDAAPVNYTESINTLDYCVTLFCVNGYSAGLFEQPSVLWSVSGGSLELFESYTIFTEKCKCAQCKHALHIIAAFSSASINQ